MNMKTKYLTLVQPVIASLLSIQLLLSMSTSAAPSAMEAARTASTTLPANMADTNEFFSTVIDNASGHYAIVRSDRVTVDLRDKSGKVIWSTNVVAGLKNIPISGEKKVNSMEMINNKLVITVGRGYASLDKKDGALTWIGSR